MITVQSSACDLLGPVRNQGRRATCLAFTASDLNALSHSVGHLSVEYLCHHAVRAIPGWTSQDGLSVEAVFDAARSPGQPVEELYQYDSQNANLPFTAPSPSLAPLYASASQRRGLSAAEVMGEVQAGRPIGIVVAVTNSLYRPAGDLVLFDPMVLPGQYHAMVAVGIGVDAVSGEPHLQLRNSWGPTWGVNGHAWISYSYLALHLVEGLVL